MTRWISYRTAEGARPAVVVGEHAHPYPGSETLLDLITADSLSRAATRALEVSPVELADLTVVEPLRPGSLRDSMCFHEHIRNSLGPVDPIHSQFPAFYLSNAAAVIGPYQDVPMAPGTSQFDFELEVAAVIGRTAHNVRPQDADSHIAGYTMYIDWSARDLQFTEMATRLGPAKGKDTATTLGPTFVTADEFAPRRAGKGFDVGMRASVNGREVVAGNWSTIDWAFSDVVAYTSRGTTLHPGDVIGSGTVGGGCLLEHYRTNSPAFQGWLEPGDIVEMSVDLIGRTRQTIVAAEPLHPLSSGW